MRRGTDQRSAAFTLTPRSRPRKWAFTPSGERYGRRRRLSRTRRVEMEPIGVYVHFPWCLKKCPYCDFVSFARERETIDHKGYADAILAELEKRRPALA